MLTGRERLAPQGEVREREHTEEPLRFNERLIVLANTLPKGASA